MASVRIQKFKSKRTAWEVFQAVHALHPTAFFLDSPDYQPPAQRYSYIGWQPSAEVLIRRGKLEIRENSRCRRASARSLWKELRRLLNRYRPPERRKRTPFFCGGLVGYWGYELAAFFEPVRFRSKPSWGNIPDLCLGLYRDLIVYDHAARCYWLIHGSESKEAMREMKAFFAPRTVNGAPAGFRFSRFQPALKRSEFEKSVRQAKAYIRAGDIYQANLSQRFYFDYQGSALALYEALRSINPSPFSAYLKIRDLEIVSSSPERLVSKRGDFCETKPIAGTRPRLPGLEKKLTRELLKNEKERAEHLMLVDLERNDLGRVCRWPSVQVHDFMSVEKYSHVLHLVSRITGRLRPGCDVFDLIQAMFPGGTITGCPKIRCMQIIDELEPEKRGIYTGSIGYVDFKDDADLNIVIRTLVLKKGKGFYQAGAGIVHDSVPAREFQETLHKGRALFEALRKAGLPS